MKESERHHYLPEFYLKCFTAEAGHFYVFDKKREIIKQAYPKQYFFGWNRNTGIIGEEKSTLLESIYGDFEAKIAPHYEEFLNTLNLNDVDLDSFFHVLRFIHILYWRIPENDDKLEKLTQELTFSETGFDIVDKITGQSVATLELQSQLKGVDLFRKMYRIFIPLLSLKDEFFKTDIENWKLYTRNDGNNLISDVPFVLERYVDFGSLNEEIVFPLAKNKILVHTRKNKPLQLSSFFKLQFDMLLLQQATQYVGCANKQYLELLVNDLYSYSKNYDFRENMTHSVFSHFK